jgi:hypothetical protein
MNDEPNQIEPEQIPEQYRDPQIDELIEVLRTYFLALVRCVLDLSRAE